MDRLHYTFYDPVPTIAPPNDDLELQLVWLYLVEQNKSGELTLQDFAKTWIDNIHYMWDEYGRCRWNLRRGVPAEACGTFENWFVSGMGSPIRSEIWACLFPGDPASAAYYAALDASLDHGVEGIVGEVYFAVIQSLVLGGATLEGALEQASQRLPADTETAQAVALVRRLHAEGMEVWECREKLLSEHGHDNFTHTPLNIALTVWAMLYGEGDFSETILYAVNGGYDTDCTAATAGAILGMVIGAENIPGKWKTPIGNGVYVGPGILGIDSPSTLEELTRRQTAQIGKLAQKSWDDLVLNPTPPAVNLATLPGTLTLTLPDGETAIWANGELPASVKSVGGATWTWDKPDDRPRFLIALASSGARLYVDDELVVDCPPGVPFVPATHRCADPARQMVKLTAGTHEVRVELNTKDPEQEATVYLSYPNLHIAPWTSEELPMMAQLPEG
jgi:ADP-ribosylglycohydrolase